MYPSTNGNDIITAAASAGAGQIHIYAKHGNDTINMDFNTINKFSAGHHVRGGDRAEANVPPGHNGSDTFNFMNIGRVNSTIVGRIEDFDASRDRIQIEGQTINLQNLPSNVRIVEFNGAHNDAGSDPQQWLLIDTNGGHIFYVLEGARIDMDGNGGSNSGSQERHFIKSWDLPNFSTLTDVDYVDPINYVPAGYSAGNGGLYIDDGDANAADVLEVIDGSAFNDVIAAGLNDDTVRAGAGNDRVWGGSGNDKLYGEDGNDVLEGGPGNDKLYGGNGNDTLRGGQGADYLNGQNGADVMGGKEGNDRLYGGNQNDRLYGDDGNDKLYGQNDDDRLYGGNGNDYLSGGSGNDVLFGQNGNDTLYGSSGNDILRGGSGNDRIIGGTGKDVVRGESGADRFEFRTGDLLAWGDLSGNRDQRERQLDVVEDFTIGTDKLDFRTFAGVDDRSDLRAYRTDLDGDMHFTVQVRSTNERVLVDVGNNVAWNEFFIDDNFLF